MPSTRVNTSTEPSTQASSRRAREVQKILRKDVRGLHQSMRFEFQGSEFINVCVSFEVIVRTALGSSEVCGRPFQVLNRPR